jgi:hypothetical protein
MFLGDFGGMPRILEKNPDFVDLDVTNQFRRRYLLFFSSGVSSKKQRNRG